MAKARSPSYPSIGLKEAVEKVRLVYQKDYQNPIPRKVAAQHMGYASLNGKSLGVLSALIKYGLLEGRGDDTKVSDAAVTIIAHPAGSPERVAVLREAAKQPDLFGELDARFNDGKASDQAIRSYLLTQKFIPAGADSAIRAYRETKQLVDAESQGYTEESEFIEEPMETAALSRQPAPKQQQSEPYETTYTPSSGGEPFRVTFLGKAMEISGRIDSAERADELVRAINALKVLLKPVDSVRPPALEADAPQKAVSLMITAAQRAQLRELGKTDEEIANMTPKEAHELLNLL